MTVVVLSAIYGAYEAAKVQPDLGVRQVMYTDNPRLEAPGWEVRHEPLPNVAGAMMRAKWWKARPDAAVPEADVTIWIDGSMTVKRPELVRVMLDRLDRRDALFLRHPWRNCIYDEARASHGPAKYVGQPMTEQAHHYRDKGHPHGWGLFATGMIVRRRTQAVERHGDAWWQEMQRWSYQDQISLPYVLRSLAPLNFGRLDDKWEHWWSIGRH